MLLDLRTLKRSGKEITEFHFEYSPSSNLAESLPECEIVFPISVTGSITLTGEHSAYLSGEIVFTLKGECSRCLSQAETVITVDFDEAVSEDSEDGYPVINDRVDLTPIVDDAVLINMPLQLLCKEDCKGICAGCGANLNNEDCKCKK